MPHPQDQKNLKVLFFILPLKSMIMWSKHCAQLTSLIRSLKTDWCQGETLIDVRNWSGNGSNNQKMHNSVTLVCLLLKQSNCLFAVHLLFGFYWCIIISRSRKNHSVRVLFNVQWTSVPFEGSKLVGEGGQAGAENNNRQIYALG